MPDIFVNSAQPNVHPSAPTAMPNRFREAISSYLYMPQQMRFETQQQDETIILLLRKHWITNLSWLFVSALLILVPVFVFPLLQFAGFVPESFTVVLREYFVLIWYLLVFTYILINFLLWYFTVSIVTNERVVDIDFSNILNKKFAETRISKIEDVTLRTGGFIRSLFDYGDVIVQTAATEAVFLFIAVPHPEMVVTTINRLMETAEGSHPV